MNIVNHLKSMINLLLFSTLALALLTTTAIAETPFPGKLPVTVTSIEAANIIHVNLETWPGFRRDIRIILPDLVLPGQGENVKECELALAKQAYDFTANFLSEAKDVSVKDMWMKNSASPDAISSIYTNNGTLDDALRKEGLAKPVSSHNEPWCY
jgi:hypothetical protein